MENIIDPVMKVEFRYEHGPKRLVDKMWGMACIPEDNQDMWKQLVWHYMPGAKDNAKNMFGMPGRQVIVHETGKKKPEQVQIDKNNGECLVFSTIAGKKYSIEAYDHKSPN